jgi:RNA 2',3'-cyclic 3'-phosphodiesterase
MVRCFVGIMVPEEIKDCIIDLQGKILNSNIQAKPVERENLHISLSFLGEVYDLQNIIEKLKYSVSGIKKFFVKIKNIRLIPNESFVRVIALDVIEESNSLENLRMRIVKNVGGESHEPHLTLCRVKKILDKKKFMEKIKQMLNCECGGFEVKNVQLIKSELSRVGPTYSIIESFSLVD